MLSKKQLAEEIVRRVYPAADDRTHRDHVRRVQKEIDTMAVIGGEQIAAGDDFTVPGLVRISWAFRKPAAKGERWKAGNEVAGPGGVSVKDADSPVVKAAVRLKANPMPAIKKLAPKTSDAAAQARFLSTRAGKAIKARKG